MGWVGFLKSFFVTSSFYHNVDENQSRIGQMYDPRISKEQLYDRNNLDTESYASMNSQTMNEWPIQKFSPMILILFWLVPHPVSLSDWQPSSFSPFFRHEELFRPPNRSLSPSPPSSCSEFSWTWFPRLALLPWSCLCGNCASEKSHFPYEGG